MRRAPLSAPERGLLVWIGIGLVAVGIIATVRGPRQTPRAVDATPVVREDVRVLRPRFLDAPSRIDVNRAGVEELADLPGIGPALAERIVAHRAEYGPFRDLDALTAVRGIGPRTVDGLRDSATVGGQ